MDISLAIGISAAISRKEVYTDVVGSLVVDKKVFNFQSATWSRIVDLLRNRIDFSTQIISYSSRSYNLPHWWAGTVVTMGPKDPHGAISVTLCDGSKMITLTVRQRSEHAQGGLPYGAR